VLDADLPEASRKGVTLRTRGQLIDTVLNPEATTLPLGIQI
jgi:hypothetical protein